MFCITTRTKAWPKRMSGGKSHNLSSLSHRLSSCLHSVCIWYDFLKPNLCGSWWLFFFYQENFFLLILNVSPPQTPYFVPWLPLLGQLVSGWLAGSGAGVAPQQMCACNPCDPSTLIILMDLPAGNRPSVLKGHGAHISNSLVQHHEL